MTRRPIRLSLCSPRPSFPRAPAALLAALALASASLACGGEPAEPVARLQVPETELTLPYPASVILDTRWELLAPLGLEERGPVVFVHLLTEEGELVRTFDHPFPGPWTPGEAVRNPLELWQSALAPPLPPGRYTLTLGLVEPAAERRWFLAFEGREVEAVDRGEYAVATVTVPRHPGADGPEVHFSGSWHPPAPGSDRQVLTTRMLADEGALELRGMGGPMEVGMDLRIPTEDEGEYRVVSEEGAGEPSVIVSSDCSREPVRIAGRGGHRVHLNLRPAPGEDRCTVLFAPDYVLFDPVTFFRATVQLRRLTWAPGEAAGPEESAPQAR